MAFNLGQAQITLTANNAPIIAQTAAAYSNVQNQARSAAAAIAQQNNLTVAEVKKATQILEQEAKKREQAAIASAKAQTQANDNLVRSFKQVGATAATLLGFGAIASSAILLREALVGLNEVTLKQEQAQRALNAAFGGAAPLMKQYADETAKTFNRVSSTVEQGTASFGILQKQYGVTTAETQKLIKVAIDLQSAYGGDLIQVFKDVSNAVQGEPQALEKYGIALQQNAIIINDAVTPAERKRYESMTAVEQAQIRMRVLMIEANKQNGAAAQRSNESAGAFDKLSRSADEFGKIIAKEVEPGMAGLARSMSGAIDKIGEFIKAQREVDNAVKELSKNGMAQSNMWGELGQKIGATGNELLEWARKSEMARAIADLAGKNIVRDTLTTIGNMIPGLTTGIGLAGQLLPNSTDVTTQINEERGRRQVETNRRIRQAQEAADLNDANAREKVRVDAENNRLRIQREAIETGLRRQTDARLKDLDNQIEIARRAEKVEIESLEARKDAHLKHLEQVEYEREKAADAELQRLQDEKAAAIDASEERKNGALEHLRAEQEAVQAVVDARISELEIARDKELQLAEQRRDDAINIETQIIRERNKLRIAEDNQLADDVKKRQRFIEDTEKASQKRIEDSAKRNQRQLDDRHEDRVEKIKKEEDRLKDKYERESTNVDELADKEEDRHKKLLREIDERERREIAAIDAQIRALEDGQKRAENAARIRTIQQKQSDTQRNLVRAQGTGTQEEVGQARTQLTLAIRLGDPEAVKKAQADLLEIAGQGASKIEEVQRELREVEQQLIDENVKQSTDAEKQRLEDIKNGITEQIRIEKQVEDDRANRRKTRIDSDKRAEKERLDDALDKLKKRKDAEDDSFEDSKRKLADQTENSKRKLQEQAENAKRSLTDQTEDAKRKIQERRTAEDEAHQDRVKEINTVYELEQDQIKETYDSEEKGLIPALKRATTAAEAHYREKRRVVEQDYKAERKEIEDTYDGPKGLIRAHREAEESAKRAYQNQTSEAQASFEAQRKAIEKSYRADDGKSGIIDRLENLKDVTAAELKLVLDKFEEHKKGLTGEDGVIPATWDAAIAAANKYFDHIKKRGGEVITPQTIRTLPSEGRNEPTPGSSAGGTSPSVLPPSSGGAAVKPPASGSGPPTPLPPITGSGEQAYADVILAASPSSYWTDQGTHSRPNGGGPAADIFAEEGTPIYSPSAGRLDGFHDTQGGNAAMLYGVDGRVHYLAHCARPFSDGTVGRGDHINEVSNTGARGTSPHLHWAIASSASIINYRGGKGDIWPPTGVKYYKTRDNGYLFQNPTATMDLRTGERGVLAEKGPERLLGRRTTKLYDAKFIDMQSLSPGGFDPDYSGVGSELANMSTLNNVNEGDNFVYNGVAPENIMDRWRSDQRRRNLLEGTGRLH